MDYVKEAVEYLKNYDNFKIALDNLKCEIVELEYSIKGLKGIQYSDMPKGSGTTLFDDELINKMFRLNKAMDEYKATTRTIKRMDEVFKKFEEENNNYGKVLKGYFIDQYTEEQLMKDLYYSDRHLRRIKQQALRSFAIQLFGVKVIAG